MTTTNLLKIEDINNDLSDDGIIYDLDITNIDILSIDEDHIEDKENGEEKRSGSI